MVEPRKYVLFAGDRDEVSRWSFWCVPADVFERLPPESQRFPSAEDMPIEIAAVMRADGRRGVGRLGAGVRWPALLGFRIVKRLAQRGHVAFVIFSDADRLSVLRAQRERAPEGRPPSGVVRVDGAAFARAMEQAGLRLRVTRSDARGRSANAKGDERDGEIGARQEGMTKPDVAP